MHNPLNAPTDKERASTITAITLYGMLMDIFLSIIKLCVGFLFHSPGLIADGMHSFSDMVSDIFVLIINRFAHDEPDVQHPYGHARFETLGAAIIGLMLILVAAGLGFEYVQDLFYLQSHAQPSFVALAVVVLSLLGKEWQFRFTMKAAKRINSKLLEANAWHSRSDALSSLVVLFGVAATLAGFPLVETVAAIVVALMIGKMGFELSWDALQQLLDTGLSEEQHNTCLKALAETDGVIDVHMLRGRLMSHQIFIDVHIQVAPQLSVSEGHQIGEWAMKNVKQALADVKDITLHIDYEEDDHLCILEFAPLRPQIEKALQDFPTLCQYQQLDIHYCKQQVSLELEFKQAPGDLLNTEINEMTDQYNWLQNVECHIRKIL